VYFRCVYDELGLECPLDCGTIDEAPVAPPSSPVMVDEGPASSAPSPSPPQTDAPGAQTGAPSPPPAAPPGSTSGASRPETCHRFVPSVATRGFLVLTAALLL
jgi:cell division septation protein DedD